MEGDGRGVVVEGEEFGMLLEAEDGVVEQDHGDREILADRGFQLSPDVAETAVAADFGGLQDNFKIFL